MDNETESQINDTQNPDYCNNNSDNCSSNSNYRDNNSHRNKIEEIERECVSPALVSYGAHGWIRVEEQTYLGFVSSHGQAEVDRIVQYIDELCQSNGNKYKWTDWAMVMDRALREKGQAYDK